MEHVSGFFKKYLTHHHSALYQKELIAGMIQQITQVSVPVKHIRIQAGRVVVSCPPGEAQRLFTLKESLLRVFATQKETRTLTDLQVGRPQE